MPFTRQMMLLQVGVVLALGVVSLVAVALLLRTSLSRQYEQRALSVARAVAADRDLGDLVKAKDQPAVDRIAEAQRRRTGALFVVVTDDHGIRLAHPNPAEIGKRVSTNPHAALSGREVANIERGTLGLSARGKVPLRDSSGTIVGEVSVGFSAQEIDHSLDRLLLIAIPSGAVAVLIAALLFALFARRLKRATFGLEPEDVADLVREREAVLYGINEGVLALDHEGTVTMCNTEAQSLLDQEVLPGAKIADVALPERIRSAFEDPSDESVIAVAGHRVLVGHVRPVRLDGRDLGSVLTIKDRTDLEELTSELASVRTMTGALRAQRHEFANRMHTVMGLLQTSSVDDALDYLRSSTQFTTGDQVSRTDAVESATVRAFIAAKTAHAAERGVTLRLSEESWVPRKLVAPVEVITVLGNLVDNAIDAAGASTRRPATVEIDLVCDESALVVSVANTGEGIPADRLDAIFVDGVSSRGRGRGMGLPIARQTARDLGGDLRVTARGEDGGLTVFVATLPGVLAAGREGDPT